jgi:hypothetical protein
MTFHKPEEIIMGIQIVKMFKKLIATVLGQNNLTPQ